MYRAHRQDFQRLEKSAARLPTIGTFLRACALATLLAGPAPAAVKTLDDFTFRSDREMAETWRALSGTPAPHRSEGGLTMSCPFDEKTDRFAWDSARSADLSPFTTFELELTCADADALRSFAVYFRSGAGWYIWNKPLRGAGRQRLTLRRADFETEGKPAGWAHISGLRLSPWRGSGRATSITFHRLTARKDALYVVKATLSASAAGDRALAARCTDRMSDWLERAGLAHAVVTEEQVAAGALADAKVVVLPLNPEPPAAVLTALQAASARGAKFLVCYSASAGLARLMGVQLGAFTLRSDPRQFESMVFAKPERWSVPARVCQSSWSIRPVTPLEGRGDVIAWWADGREAVSRQPACVATDRGFWFTHVLLLDDTFAKEEMLLGLLGSLDRGLWFQAARKAMEEAGRIDHFADVEAATAGIARQAAGRPDEAAVTAALAGAAGTRVAMRSAFNTGDYAGAVRSARVLREKLVLAYSLSQSSRGGEFRGVWDHDGTGWWPGDWDRSCRLLADSGMTAILPNLMWAGLAHYPSRVVAGSETLRRYGDQAAQCLKAARAHGLQMHVWKVCWNVEQAPDAWVANLRKQGRLLKGSSGQALNWLDPAQAANVELELSTLREMAKNYAVDGIHLDYIRYPPGLPKGAVKPAAITEFVRRAREELKAIRPELKLSAAVWGAYPSCVASVGQDWGAWLKAGQVDFVCPMNYTTDRFRFSALLGRQVVLPGARGRIYPGLGLSADESQLRADQVIDQILAAREGKASGFVLFDLCAPLRDEVLPALARGVTRTR